MHWQDLSVAHIDDLSVPLLVSLLTPVQSWQPSYTWLDNFTTRGLVVCSSSCLTVWQDKAWEMCQLKPLNVAQTANSCSKQVVSQHPSLLSHMPHNPISLAYPWAMTMTCYWLDKTINTKNALEWKPGKMLTHSIHTSVTFPIMENDNTEIMMALWDTLKFITNINNIISVSHCVYSTEIAEMWTKAAEKGFCEYFKATQYSNPCYSLPTVSWLACHKFLLQPPPDSQNLRFPSATSQVAFRAFSVSPAIYSVKEILLQKLTVHHKTSCNEQWVVTSQAERPSAHGGVQEIFLSLSMPGQRTQNWHQALLTK